jgi:hypothetical protein
MWDTFSPLMRLLTFALIVPVFTVACNQTPVAQARLGLNQDNFFLLGHSWGGILAIPISLLPERQPYVDVRRPANLFQRHYVIP